MADTEPGNLEHTDNGTLEPSDSDAPPDPLPQSWKEMLGDEYYKPGMCRSVPDYIVADIKNLKATENTTLRQIASPITFPIPDEEVTKIAQLKWKFENCLNCWSISAPQIGFPKRIMCYFKPKAIRTKLRVKDKYPVYTLINPTYEPLDNEMMIDYEKCTSVKDVCALVNRYENIYYKAYNIFGDIVKGEAHGVIARWIQHEIDHMNGLLFIDQAANIITIKEHRWRRSIGKLEWYLDVPGW